MIKCRGCKELIEDFKIDKVLFHFWDTHGVPLDIAIEKIRECYDRFVRGKPKQP